MFFLVAHKIVIILPMTCQHQWNTGESFRIVTTSKKKKSVWKSIYCTIPSIWNSERGKTMEMVKRSVDS